MPAALLSPVLAASVCLLALPGAQPGPGAHPAKGGAAAGARDQVETTIHARVAPDLETVRVEVRSVYRPAVALDAVPIILAAARLGEVPRGMRPSEEREVFSEGEAFGGFTAVEVEVDGRPCAAPAPRGLSQGGAALLCPARVAAGQAVRVEMRALLSVPPRYGELGRHGRQLTLGAGWYPYVARTSSAAAPPLGPHRVTVEIPPDAGAVLGRRYFAPTGEPPGEPAGGEPPGEPAGGGPQAVRVIEDLEPEAVQVPLVVLPPTAGAIGIEDSEALLVGPSAATIHDPRWRSAEDEQIALAIADGLRFWRESGLALSSTDRPFPVVKAALRHVLALPADGLVLVSDRAFRMPPFDRLYRFHRFPILRELYAALFFDRFRASLDAATAADAAAAWLVDRYVASRFGRREVARDLLDWFSFIPSIDALLYAPDLPFESAYFRRVREDDPIRPDLLDYPRQRPRGKIVYEKLLDRAGRQATDAAIQRLLAGRSLRAALEPALGAATPRFLATWLGPYPETRYRLARFESAPAPPGAPCGACYVARVEIAREGAPVEEPIEVRLRDRDGNERHVWSNATAAALRTVTATLAAPLEAVELDPRERIYEAPSDEDPSPRIDNASSASWKVLLNSWNFAFAATAGTFNSILDVGFLRVYDVHWSYALQAAYDPAAIGLFGRASYGLGNRVTPAALDQRIGVTFGGSYLRPQFAAATQSAFALSTAVYYAFDTRQTLWAPEGGRGLRLVLGHDHLFGRLVETETSGAVRPLTEDDVSLTARGFWAWRSGASSTLALRGIAGSYVYGTPRQQLLYPIGGRAGARGYQLDSRVGRVIGMASTEWVHALIPETNHNVFYYAWLSGIDGTVYADVATVADRLADVRHTPPAADVGYGLRIYIDYLGLRPGVMAIDVACPLVSLAGRAGLGAPQIYIDFTQSF